MSHRKMGRERAVVRKTLAEVEPILAKPLMPARGPVRKPGEMWNPEENPVRNDRPESENRT